MSDASHKGNPDILLVALRDRSALVRVQGRGSFRISPALKRFGAAAIERGTERFVFDLHHCIGMDSTFMGVLAGLAFKLRELNRGGITMINLTSRTRGLLATLGLDQLIQPCMEGSAPEDLVGLFADAPELSRLDTSTTQRDTAETMLRAHEDLVDLCPENLPKFKDVLTFLREDLGQDPDGTASEG